MPETTLRGSSAPSADRVPLLLALLGMGVVASSAAVLGPEALSSSLIAAMGVVVVALRPQWGVAALLLMLMVQYGSRRYEREGVAGLASLVPVGSGLVTVNNVLGLFLALMVVYHVYRDGDWSFLRNRQVQLVAAITAVLVFSGLISGLDPAEQIDLGLRLTGGQDPQRLLISRALFLVLFVFFIKRPSDLRMIVALFVLLAVGTAWSGSSAAMVGGGRPEVAEYRAGGVEVLIQSTQNPNRLALIATLALVFIWEYGQAHRMRRWGGWLLTAAVALLLVLTVFLSASRGGVVGLSFAALMLFVRRRTGSARLLYGIAVAIIGWMLVSQVVPEQALERITNIPGFSGSSEGEGSLQRRGYTYGVAVDIWADAPIVGIGPGNWPFVRFMTDPLRSAAAPHSSYLKALAEGGALTLALYLALFFVTLRDLWRCERSPAVIARARADGLDWLVPATRICLASFMVFSLFADLWDLIFSYLLIGIAAVLIKRYGGLVEAAPAPVGRLLGARA
jgi:O-antigen ligase